jgi:hypothetical protein
LFPDAKAEDPDHAIIKADMHNAKKGENYDDFADTNYQAL